MVAQIKSATVAPLASRANDEEMASHTSESHGSTSAAAASSAAVSRPATAQTLILAAYSNAETKGCNVSHPPADEVVRVLEIEFDTDAYNAAKALHVCFGIRLPHVLSVVTFVLIRSCHDLQATCRAWRTWR
jgi:hypothetical protein